MDVGYQKSFLKDLKQLRGQPAYQRIFDLAFSTLPDASGLRDVPNVIAMRGFTNRYRIRVGDYRVGIEVNGSRIEIVRVLHRREFYRYFP